MLITTLKKPTHPSRNTQNAEDTYGLLLEASTLGPGVGVERLSVGPYTLNESNKRGDRMEHWLMIKNFVTLNTTYKKCQTKRPVSAHRKLRVNRQKSLRYSRVVEAFDMVHMASDHRCVMAHFVFPAAKKNDFQIKHKKRKIRRSESSSRSRHDKKYERDRSSRY